MARGGMASTSSCPVARLARPAKGVSAKPARYGSACKQASNSRQRHNSTVVKAVPSSLVYDSSPYERNLRRQAAFLPAEPIHLVLPKSEHKETLQNAVHEYYDSWNLGSMDSFDELCQQSVTYSDVLRSDCDYYGRASLKKLVGDFTASHPLLHIEVDDVMTDVDRDMAVAHWRATSADLLPHADGTPATGRVSEIHGMDRFTFDGATLQIKSIASYRERFADEDSTPVDFEDEDDE